MWSKNVIKVNSNLKGRGKLSLPFKSFHCLFSFSLLSGEKIIFSFACLGLPLICKIRKSKTFQRSLAGVIHQRMHRKNPGWSVDLVCLSSATSLQGDLGRLMSSDFTYSTCKIEVSSQVIAKALSNSHILWLCALEESQWHLSFSHLPSV